MVRREHIARPENYEETCYRYPVSLKRTWGGFLWNLVYLPFRCLRRTPISTVFSLEAQSSEGRGKCAVVVTCDYSMYIDTATEIYEHARTRGLPCFLGNSCDIQEFKGFQNILYAHCGPIESQDAVASLCRLENTTIDFYFLDVPVDSEKLSALSRSYSTRTSGKSRCAESSVYYSASDVHEKMIPWQDMRVVLFSDEELSEISREFVKDFVALMPSNTAQDD